MSNEKGIKHDNEKAPLDLLSPIAMEEIAKVMGYGAKKYAKHNWKNGLHWSRVLAAALRHLFSFLGGQDKDPETGLSHLAHAGCCIMFLLEYEATHKELDDRYKHTVVCDHKYFVPLDGIEGKCINCSNVIDMTSYL